MTKANSEKGSELAANSEHIHDNIKMVTPTFGLTLYTDKLFSSIPKAILKSFDAFRALCPEAEIKHYATENMSKHKPVTPRVLGMLASWLKPGAPQREYIMLELKNGDDYRDAASFKFMVFGGEKESIEYDEKQANLLAMSFPVTWIDDRHECQHQGTCRARGDHDLTILPGVLLFDASSELRSQFRNSLRNRVSVTATTNRLNTSLFNRFGNIKVGLPNR